MKKTHPLTISKYGTIEKRYNALLRPDLKQVFNLATIFTVIFIIVDTACLYVSFDSIQTDNKYFILLISIVGAMCLDVPAYYIGKCLKEYFLGMKKKSEATIVVSACIAVFVLFAVLFGGLRILTREATFNPPTAASVTNTIGQAAANTPNVGKDISVIFASVILAVIPLGTSFISLIITFMTTNPLEEKINKLKKSKLLANNHRVELIQALCEEKDLDSKSDLLIEKENLEFLIGSKKIYARSDLLNKGVYAAILEELNKQEEVETAIKNLNVSDEPDSNTAVDFTRINSMVTGIDKGHTYKEADESKDKSEVVLSKVNKAV